jgi:hypothetical protein
MSNVPLGSGARQNAVPASTDPTAIPTLAPITAPTPVQAAPDPSQAGAAAAPTAATPSESAPAAPVEPSFDASAFQAGFAALKTAVTAARASLTQDVADLQSEDQQLEASIADWDARAAAAEDRRQQIKTSLDGKLNSFAELDQATSHLEATEALLYPKPAAQ